MALACRILQSISMSSDRMMLDWREQVACQHHSRACCPILRDTSRSKVVPDIDVRHFAVNDVLP